MSIFSGNILNEEAFDDGEDLLSEAGYNALEEQYLIEECSRMSEDELQEFLESDLCETLVTEGKMRKNTIVWLSGRADLDRRTKMAALQAAKEKNDPLWDKLKKNRMKERELISKIMRKYGSKSRKVAKQSQKDWIRNRMPANFGKFGGQARLSAEAKANIREKNKMTGAKKHGDGLTW